MPSTTGILLLHGLTGVPSEMRPVEKYFQKLGYETLAPTLSGHGGTHNELLAVTWEHWIEGAQKALDELLSRVNNVVICGLSMGSSIGSILAVRNPRVIANIMLSPTLVYDCPGFNSQPHLKILKSQFIRDLLHIACTVSPLFGRTFYWTETPPYGLKDERLQRQITKAIDAAKRGEDTKFGLFRTYFGSLKEMNHLSDEFKRVAHQVKCPTLVIASMEDTLVSVDNATRAYSKLGAKNKSLILLTGCDHVLTLDLKRKYVCRLIGEFMSALNGSTSDTEPLDDSGLTIEIHNGLNPVASSEWSRLVPDGRPLLDLVELLRQMGVHEQQCYTMVPRFNNVPQMIMPFVVDQQQQSGMLGVEHKSIGKYASQADLSVDDIRQITARMDNVHSSLWQAFGVKKVTLAKFDKVSSEVDRQPVAASRQ